jgi:cell fate regulator YaaT (PSP1 superfamily)
LTEIIGVRFKRNGKIYYFDPDGIQFTKGDRVVVETARGTEMSEVWLSNRSVEDAQLVQPLRKVLRPATEEDIATVERNEARAKDAFELCEKKIAAHGLEMKLTEAEYAFDGSKLLFYFTADGRVDFRDLVKDLASVFRIRIELRQIGVRDEAKMYGGLGVCGRPLCCATFLDDFHPVSIKMAREQGLSLNPTKISGTCSRLMCCLKYEQGAYEDLLKHAPRVDSVVQTPAGVGTIMDVSLLKQQIKVRFDKPGELPKYFNISECKVMSDNR